MANKKEIMIAMYDKGMTYQQIGEVFGISKQAVHQLINSGDGVRLSTLAKIPYIGLRMWMLANRVTVKELNKRVGTATSITGGSNPRMDTINKILKVTGLTYEECFKTEVDDG